MDTKRHIVTSDTLGLILAVVVHAPAAMQDRDGAKRVLQQLVRVTGTRLRLIWADGGYAGQLLAWATWMAHWTVEIVKRTDDVKGFKVLPKRWIVERTFKGNGWAVIAGWR